MKKIFFVILLNLIFISSFSQITFGVKAGLNTSGITNNSQNLSFSQYRKGLTLGGYSIIGITKNLSLQPELLFSDQGSGKLSMNYITLPFLLKLKTNGFLSLIAGAQYGYLLSSKIMEVSSTELYNSNYTGLILGTELKFNNKIAVDLRFGSSLSDLNNKNYYKKLFSNPFWDPALIDFKPSNLSNKYFSLSLCYRIF